MVPHAPKRRKIDVQSRKRKDDFSEQSDELENGRISSGGSGDEHISEAWMPAQVEQRPRAQRNGDMDLKASQAFVGESNRSTMFKLQIDELLAEIRPHHRRKSELLEGTLRRFKGILEALPERPEMNVSEAEKGMHNSDKITVPFPEPRPPKVTNYKVAFSRPANINVVGSFALKTAVKQDGIITVDMAVEMPSTIFQEKDYLNYRYFHKRAYYLSCLAAGIKADKVGTYDMRFTYLNDNPLLPILQLTSSKGDEKSGINGSKCHIHVVPVVGAETFKMSKILPDSCCVRRKNPEEEDLEKGTATRSTPFYNATLRADSLFTYNLKALHAASVQCSSFQDACLLGRTWLRQRGFESSVARGGCGYFEWAAMMAVLLQGGGHQGKGVLSSGYSAYQLFKAMLSFLSSRDLATSPLFFKSKGISIPESGGPYFYDGVKGINVLFKMSIWSYRKLRHEAKMSVQMLNDTSFDHFEETFILNTDSHLQKFDNYIRAPIAALTATQDFSTPDATHNSLRLCQKVYRVLNQGLGDRARLIDLSWPCSKAWSLKASPSSVETDGDLVIGFILNPANVTRTVDHGPAAEEKSAAEQFRDFWGDKAELRRFKDGRILESLVWSDKAAGMSIFRQIITHILNRHIGTSFSQAMSLIGEDFDDLLSADSSGNSLNVASFQPLINTFDELEKSIRATEGLPLQVRQVSPASPELSYTSIHIPRLDRSRHDSMSPASVVISFEGSGRWPEDLAAIQRTKVAILLKMGELLEEAIDGIATRVGLENENSEIMNATFLDVIHPNNAVFRFRVQADREQYLLEKRLKQKDIGASSREEAAFALSRYKSHFLASPSHTQALRTLCTRFPFLSPSIRLVKRWFDAHLLSCHISEEVVELFVARVFVLSHPYEPPASVRTGFLRTMHLLSRWDWRNEPLIVDLSGEMAVKTVESIKLRFEAWRKLDPAMNRVALFVASNLDIEGVTWTQQARPSKVAAARMTALARSACAEVKERGLDLDPKTLFASSPADYDFVIHLHPRFGGSHKRRASKRSTEYKNLQIQSESQQDVDLVTYDPVGSYVDELKSLYGTNIVFFHRKTSSVTSGTDSGNSGIVAGLWNPQTTAPRDWKVNLTYSTKPISTSEDPTADSGDLDDGTAGREPQLQVNKAAILNEIARLGGDMVSSIEEIRG